VEINLELYKTETHRYQYYPFCQSSFICQK